MGTFRFRPRRSGQSAVETLLATPFILMVFIAMYYFWSITFASQNAHMRAREYILHQDTYLQGRAYNVSGGSVWSGDNYQLARNPLNLTASSQDTSLEGFPGGTVSIDARAYLVTE